MKALKVVIYGSSGRMGKNLLTCLKKDKRFSKKVLKISSKSPKTSFKDYDLLIDFSSPKGFNKLLSEVKNTKIKIISGTTGLSKKEFNSFKKLSQKTAVFYSSNFSLGIGFLHFLIKTHKNFLDSFDYQVKEIHHKHKKDKPSGTALSLEENLKKSLRKKGKKTLSYRKGEEIGLHEVHFLEKKEKLVFSHKALKRSIFAKGALDVASWLSNKKKGFYNMDQYFKEKLK